MKHTRISSLTLISAVSALAFFTAVGCASKSEKQTLNDKVSAEGSVHSPSTLSAETVDTIQNSKDLSADQKAQLATLRTETRAKMEAYRQESLKLQSVLVKDVVSPNYDISEVNLIKSRLRKVENDRVNLIFDTVDKANTIMGRQALNNQEVMHTMYGNEGAKF